MIAGKLRQRVIVERPQETQGASGAMTTTWVLVATVWGSVAPSGVRERLTANQILADLDTVIRLRWAPIIQDIDATWRLRVGSTIYNIIGVSNLSLANRELEMMCVSGKNDG